MKKWKIFICVFVFILGCLFFINKENQVKDVLYLDGITLKGEGIHQREVDVMRYDAESDQYKSTLEYLEKDYVVHYLDVIDFNFTKNSAATKELNVEIKYNDDMKDTKGQFLLLDKEYKNILNVSLKDSHIAFTSDKLDRIIICKMEKKSEIVKKISLSEANVSAIKEQIYTGQPLTPSPYITYKNKTLIKDTDYTLTYTNHTKVGTGNIEVKGIGDYEGSLKLSFKIVDKTQESNDTSSKKISIDNAVISTIQQQKYTGHEIKPAFSLKINNKTLKEGRDYKVSYSHNTEVGKAYMTITGIGNYEGVITASFDIIENKKEMKQIRLNEKTTHHGFVGYYTKDTNILHVDKGILGLNENDSVSLYFIEYYDEKTKESILFACPYVQEVEFMRYVDNAGGWDSIPVQIIER